MEGLISHTLLEKISKSWVAATYLSGHILSNFPHSSLFSSAPVNFFLILFNHLSSNRLWCYDVGNKWSNHRADKVVHDIKKQRLTYLKTRKWKSSWRLTSLVSTLIGHFLFGLNFLFYKITKWYNSKYHQSMSIGIVPLEAEC